MSTLPTLFFLAKQRIATSLQYGDRRMAFRHPHPIIHWLAFLGVTLALLMPGLAEFRDLPPETGFLSGLIRVTTPVLVSGATLATLVGCLGLLIHRIAQFRPGNRVRITRGEHAGSLGVVSSCTDRRPAAPLSVRLDTDQTIVRISRYNAVKQGLWSAIF